MSLDYALEKFPLETKLHDGTECTIRPLGKRDVNKCERFFSAVPEVERLFIKRPMTKEDTLHDWCKNLDYEQNLVLLMIVNRKIVGEATLHQRQGGWKRHVGLVTLLTHPDFRDRGVSKIMVGETIEVARHLGLKKLEAELNGERTVAIQNLEELGFRQLMRLPDYVWDMQCTPHDYVFMGMDLLTAEEFAGQG